MVYVRLFAQCDVRHLKLTSLVPGIPPRGGCPPSKTTRGLRKLRSCLSGGSGQSISVYYPSEM